MNSKQNNNTVSPPKSTDFDALLQQMQEPIHYDVKENLEAEPSSFFSRLPFVSKFIAAAEPIGTKVVAVSRSALGLTQEKIGGETVPWVGFGLSVVDFLKIPFIYLAAFICGEKVPFTLTNNAKWAYSAVLLGLGLTSILVPVAAPFIGVAIGGLALVSSLVVLGNVLYERYQLGKQNKRLMTQIAWGEEEMLHMQEEARTLQVALHSPIDEAQNGMLQSQILELKERYESKKIEIAELKGKQLAIQNKMNNLGLMHVIDKSVTAGLSGLAVVGAVLAIFFPPVGLPMLVGVAAVGLTYVVGRIAAPHIQQAGSWLKNKLVNFFHKEPSSEAVNANALNNTPVEQSQNDSTADMFSLLGVQETSKTHEVEQKIPEVAKTPEQPQKELEQETLTEYPDEESRSSISFDN